MEKKDAAWLLFDSGRTQKDIAKVLQVQEHTVGRWKNKYGWDKKKEAKRRIRESIREDVFDLIQYQTRVLKLKKRDWEKLVVKYEAGECNVADLKIIQRGDIDALQKLFTTVKEKANIWSDYVQVISEFMKYMEEVDFNASKNLVDHTENFLNLKRENI
jgi:hypothetical protein